MGSQILSIDALVRKTSELQGFQIDEFFNVIKFVGRNLEITEDRLMSMGYGSDTIHLLFNLWYREYNYTPSYRNSLPEVDHIFPQTLLKKVKETNPDTGRQDLMKYKEAQRNVLANCMLLSKEENGAGGKSDTPPSVWFADKDEKYLEKHLIPNKPELWELDRYEDFLIEREKLIKKKFEELLISK